MNYEQADSVKKLASKVNKVLEGLEIECPECKGCGKQISDWGNGTIKEIFCEECKGEGKIKRKCLK